jgi:DNA-binding winged helix-turn-helix (wHTH) protein
MADRVRFGLYELDRDARELRRRGVLIRLQDQPFRVLAILTGRPGEIVTREQLQQQIWGKETFVDFDQSLNKAVNRIREALNDEADSPQYIETVPRRGYRFIAPIEGHAGDGGDARKISSDTSDAISDADFQPQPSVPTTVENEVASSKRPRRRKAGTAIAVGSTLVAALVLSIWLLLPTPQPRVLRSTPLTNDGKPKCCLVTDGSRIYFSEKDSGTSRISINYVPVTGGNPTAIPAPSLEGDLVVTDISRDHDRLLVEALPSNMEGTLWSVPLAASSPRPLTEQHAAGDFPGAKWSPDGRSLLYSNGSALYLAHSDGSEPKRFSTRKVLSITPPGRRTESQCALPQRPHRYRVQAACLRFQRMGESHTR